MSIRGQFNTKSPTIKRILKEASEIATNPSLDFHATPLESNLFEWHFTLRGPPSPSPYAGGTYHGRIVLPPTYPLRPPSFRFLTPSGRFEVNREICLSISGHHEETWQPAWGIRTAMVAIRSFMDTDAKGQVGGLECSESARRKMADESRRWRCAGCGKTNEETMAESDEEVKRLGEATRKEVVVPEELRLAYREELGKEEDGTASESSTVQRNPASAQQGSSAPLTSQSKGKERADVPLHQIPDPSLSTINAAPTPSPTQTAPLTTNQPTALLPTRTIQLHPAQPHLQTDESVPPWIDKAIWGVLAALVFMILRKVF